MAQEGGRTGRRWSVGMLLGAGVLINYFDRVNLSVAMPDITREFSLTPIQAGYFLSAFFWTYAMLQIPAGMFLDRFGVTRIGRWGAFLWGVASTITALASGYAGIVVARALLGIAEAPGFPVSSKATGYWFPRRERALATAIFDAAAKFSNVIGVPLIGLVVFHYGWRAGFYFTACLSFLYFIAFYVIYRDPSADTRVNAAELQYIREGGAAPEGAPSGPSLASLGYLLSQRKIWGLTLGFAAYGYSFYLFLTWLPGYLVKTMGWSVLKSASFTAIPWMVATITDLAVGGFLIDALVSRGYSESRVRKTVLIVGMLFGLAVIGATQTTDPVWAVVWISIALGGLASAAPVGWSLPSLISPKGSVGTVGGIMNFANNVAGAIAPIVTGYIVERTGSFSGAFSVAAAVLVLGILSFVFLLGRIEPIPEQPR